MHYFNRISDRLRKDRLSPQNTYVFLRLCSYSFANELLFLGYSDEMRKDEEALGQPSNVNDEIDSN